MKDIKNVTDYNEMKGIAKELGISSVGKKKETLIFLIDEAQKKGVKDGTITLDESAETSEPNVQESGETNTESAPAENIDDILAQAEKQEGKQEPDSSAKDTKADGNKVIAIDSKKGKKGKAADNKADEKAAKDKKAETGKNKSKATGKETVIADYTDAPKIMINRNELVPSPMNFFHPLSEQKFNELVDSIKKNGILVPLIVRPLPKGDKRLYEIIAGENRWRAAEVAGKEMVPCQIIQADDDKAMEILVDTNYTQRDQLTPMELARVFAEKKDIIGKRQGKRTDKSGEEGGNTRDIIAKDYKISGMTVDRYLRLNNLIPELQKAVDDEKLSAKAGMELGMLDKVTQGNVLSVKKDVLDTISSSVVGRVKEIVKDKNNISKEEIEKLKAEGKKPEIKPATVEEITRAFKTYEEEKKNPGRAMKFTVVVPDNCDEDTMEFIEGNILETPIEAFKIIQKYATGKLKEAK